MMQRISYIVEVHDKDSHFIGAIKVTLPAFGGDPTARSAAIKYFKGYATRIVAKRAEPSSYRQSVDLLPINNNTNRKELENEGFSFLTKIHHIPLGVESEH